MVGGFERFGHIFLPCHIGNDDCHPMFNTGGICVHAIDDAEDKVLASVNGENPEWCEMAEQPQEDGDEMESGFLFGSFFVAFSGVIRMGMD